MLPHCQDGTRHAAMAAEAAYAAQPHWRNSTRHVAAVAEAAHAALPHC